MGSTRGGGFAATAEGADARNAEAGPAMIDARVEYVELTRCLELVEWGRRKTSTGNDFSTVMPEIEDLRTTSGFDVPDGGFAMIGVLQRDAAPGKRILLFARCDVLEFPVSPK